MPRKFLSRAWLPSWLLFLASLSLLRQQLLLDLDMTLAQGFTAGIGLGLFYDVAISFLAPVAGWLLAGALGLPRANFWAAGALLIWLTTLSNVLYFRFFRGPLDWWVVSLHWRDILVVRGSAGELALSWPILASAAFLVAALVWVLRPAEQRRTRIERGFAPRAAALAAGLGLFVLMLLFRQSPVWFNIVNYAWMDRMKIGTVLNTQTLVRWWEQTHGNESRYRERRKLSFAEGKDSAHWLAQYRDFSEESVPTAPKQGDWPLLTQVSPDPKETRAFRYRLGLPSDKPVNVLFLFLESVRAFEIDHPVLGPKIFPGLRSVLASNSIYFTQAYTSALTAGQTVRGQFTTLCSMLPNITGPAPYIAHPTVRVDCLQSIFKNAGYRTAWINSEIKTFHNKYTFEHTHGTELFFDKEYFESKGITEMVGPLGYADKPVLKEALEILKRIDSEGKPFFANVLTTSSHHPPNRIPGVTLDPEIEAAASRNPDALGYLTQLKYVDEAVTEFFDAFFASKLAENTVVVLLGDHSTSVPTYLPLNPVQATEIQFRIPVAIVSKGLKGPERIATPIHQLDVAPIAQRIAGLTSRTTWLGRNPLLGVGSPWIYQSGDSLHYRTRNLACYSLKAGATTTCFKAGGLVDPLFATSLEPAQEALPMSDFFRKVVRANSLAIELNRIAPPEI